MSTERKRLVEVEVEVEQSPLVETVEKKSNVGTWLLRQGAGAAVVVAICVAAMLLIFGLYWIVYYISYDACVHSDNPWRLPRAVWPTLYKLHMRPSMDKLNFTGSVDIGVSVQQVTSCIKINLDELNVDAASVKLVRPGDAAKKEQPTTFAPKRVIVDAEHKIMTIDFGKALATAEDYTLSMNFDANLRTDLAGFYQATYKADDGKGGKRDVRIAATQFEPNSARMAFPSFDEVEFKANFSVSIELPVEDKNVRKVLSNMPVESQQDSQDGKTFTTTFATSPRMSTYLLAFVVGEFDYVETMGKAGKRPDSADLRYRVYTPVGQSDKGKYALDIATKVTPFYSDFFGIDYVLPKMDLIAIPDFAAGAMENWGLITFRDSALLVDSVSSSAADRKGVALVTAHEIAHQWTGNLVTTFSWSELWLNEGFATFFEVYALDKVVPELNIWESFLIGGGLTMQQMMAVDALPSTHPIILSDAATNTSTQMNSMFDTISYVKGASVLRLVQRYIGDEKFQAWMKLHIATSEWRNAHTDYLLQELDQITGQQLSPLVRGWLTQPGYPRVTLERVQGDTFRFVQHRFLSLNETVANPDATWWLPITYFDDKGRQFTVEFNSSSSAVFNVPADVQWVKANPGQYGVFRTNYGAFWPNLVKAVEQGQIAQVADRFGLLDDVFSLGMAEDTSMSNALDMAWALRAERTSAIWRAIIINVQEVGQVIAAKPYYGLYNKFLLRLISGRFDELGWDRIDGESEDQQLLRSLLVNAQITLAHNHTVISQALDKFANMATKPIQPELRGAVYSAVVMAGGEDEFNGMIDRMTAAAQANDPNERDRAMLSLASSRMPYLLRKALDMTLSDKIRSQDGWKLIRAVANGGATGAQITFDWMMESFDALLGKYGGDTISSRLLVDVASKQVTTQKADQVKAFYGSEKNAELLDPTAVDEAVQTIRGNAAALLNNGPVIQQWLTRFS